jgi:hypothetical protein
MKRWLCFLLLACSICAAQDAAPGLQSVSGAKDLEFFAEGGKGASGSTSSTGAFDAGVRYGWVLTDEYLPSLLKGRFEYAVDFIPVYILSQRTDMAYGVSFDPFMLKWNFSSSRHVIPFAELGGGVLFTNNDAPPGTSQINFTPQGGFGVHVPFGSHEASLALKYIHISNAGLSRPNPGINTVQFRLGIGRMRKH